MLLVSYVDDDDHRRFAMSQAVDGLVTRLGRVICKATLETNRNVEGRIAADPLPQRRCSAFDCDRPRKTRGMCSLHYRRWLSRGTTDPRPRVGEGLRDFTPEELQIADRVYRRRFYLRNIAQGFGTRRRSRLDHRL